MARGVFLAVATGFVFVVNALPARAAGDDPELKLVKDMLRDAIAAEQAGKCQDALAMLKQAAAIRETAAVMLHEGTCEAQGGLLLRAKRTLEKSQAAASAEKDTATQASAAAALEALHARTPTLALKLPAGETVKVSIDGLDVRPESAVTPTPFDPGPHTVEVASSGKPPFHRTVTLAEKDVVALEVSFGDSTEAEPTVKHDSFFATVPAGSWAAVGAAVVLAGAGTIAFVEAGNVASSAKSACSLSVTCDQSPRGAVHGLDALALGGWIGAGVGAGVAVGLWAFERPVSRPQPHAGAPSPAPVVSLKIRPGFASLRATF